MALTHRQLFTPSNLKMLVLTTSIFFVFGSTVVCAQEPQNQSDKLANVEKLIDERAFERAYHEARALALIDQDNAKAWFYVGVSSIELEHLKEGTDALRKSIKIDPSFAPAHTFLADALLRQGALPGASIEVNEALQLSPADPYANYTRASISFQQNRMEEAARYAEVAYSGKTDFYEAYLLRAQALIGRYQPFRTADDATKENILTRYRTAADVLSRYIDLSPNANQKRIWFDQVELLRTFPFDDQTQSVKPHDTRARIISKPEPQYTEQARKHQITGTVILRALFESDGTVKKIFICQSLRGGLTEASVNAAAEIKFTPATVNGVPVPMWMQLEYNFNLY